MIKVERIRTKEADETFNKMLDNDGYCPCLLVKTENTKCMCKNFRDKIKDLQPDSAVTCHCGVYKAINIIDND